MTALNNLISRVKNIFGRKATPATNAATSAEPPTDISVVSDPRLKAALADIEKYLADNFGTPTAKLQYKEYTNGANLTSEDATFSVSLVILTEAEGAAHLPRQRVAARRSHINQRCKMAQCRAEKVHQLPHAALPQAPHPAPRPRLLQRQA